MDIPEKLRRNYVAIVTNLREQEIICSYLYQEEVITQSTSEFVLSHPTNTSQNRALLSILERRCRYNTQAFQCFCEALEKTKQDELLELLLH